MAKRKIDYKQVIESLEVDDDLNQTFSSDVDYPDDMPLIEEEYQGLQEVDFDEIDFEDEEEPSRSLDFPTDDITEEVIEEEEEEEEEYTEEEIAALIARIDLADSDRNKLSFDDLMPKKKKKTGIIVQRKERKVHHLLVLRDNVIMYPSVCKLQHCKYDAAKALGYKKRGWPDVPRSKHKLIERILEEHMMTHKFVDDSVMDLADVSQAWLTPS